MDTKRIFLIIILAAIATGAVLVVRQYHPSSLNTRQGSGAHVIYYCPMHPSYTSDRPGVCPICGMTLVLKHDHPQDSGAGIPGYVPVAITSQAQSLAGVRTAVVQKMDLVKTFRTAGYVSTNNDLFKLQDEFVKDYNAYLTVSRDYKRFEHSRRNWETHRELKMKIHDEEDKLLSLGLGTGQIEQLQKFSWKSPWNQQDILFLNDTFEYWVIAQVFESDLGSVHAGQEVEVTLPAYGQVIQGVLRSVGGIIDPATRTVNALIQLGSKAPLLKGNMLVDVVFPVKLDQVIAVPSDAVMNTGTRKIIFVQGSQGQFEPREIKTGMWADNGVEVTAGLKEGETVVVSGNFLLDSESRVQATLKGDSHE